MSGLLAVSDVSRRINMYEVTSRNAARCVLMSRCVSPFPPRPGCTSGCTTRPRQDGEHALPHRRPRQEVSPDLRPYLDTCFRRCGARVPLTVLQRPTGKRLVRRARSRVLVESVTGHGDIG